MEKLALGLAAYLAIGGCLAAWLCTELWAYLDHAERRSCARLAAELGLLWPALLPAAVFVVSTPNGNAWLRRYAGLDDEEGEKS